MYKTDQENKRILRVQKILLGNHLTFCIDESPNSQSTIAIQQGNTHQNVVIRIMGGCVNLLLMGLFVSIKIVQERVQLIMWNKRLPYASSR